MKRSCCWGHWSLCFMREGTLVGIIYFRCRVGGPERDEYKPMAEEWIDNGILPEKVHTPHYR